MTYAINLDEMTASTLKIKLYRNVKNVTELRQKLMSGALKCCIVKPSLIVDPFQITVATNKALTAEKLKTKSVYTEILYNLSVSKNISQSLQTFGVDDKDVDVLVAVVCRDGESDGQFKDVRGEETDINVLKDLTDVGAVKKTYKINDIECKEITLLDSVISRIAVKDCLL